MSTADLALRRIEAILAEIEHLEAETGGKFREEGDREAFDIAARIERRMLRNGLSASQENQKKGTFKMAVSVPFAISVLPQSVDQQIARGPERASADEETAPALARR
jgi:hypothetical protein